MATSVPALWIQGGFLHRLNEKLHHEGPASRPFPSNSPAIFCRKRSGLKNLSRECGTTERSLSSSSRWHRFTARIAAKSVFNLNKAASSLTPKMGCRLPIRPDFAQAVGWCHSSGDFHWPDPGHSVHG
jgi:hypothetical protein